MNLDNCPDFAPFDYSDMPPPDFADCFDTESIEAKPMTNTDIYHALIDAKKRGDDSLTANGIIFFLVRNDDTDRKMKQANDNGIEWRLIDSRGAYLRCLIQLAPLNKLNWLGKQLAEYFAKKVPYMEANSAASVVYDALAERGNDGSKVKPLDIINRNVKKRSESSKVRNRITSKHGIEVANFNGLPCPDNKKNEVMAKVIINSGLGKIWLDSRGLGAGKTKLLEEIAKLLKNIDIAYICHRVSLTKDAANRLQFTSYHEADPNERADRIALCVNSIVKFSIAGYKVIFLDEFRQTLEHIAMGTVDNRKQCLAYLANVIKRADLVMCSDADMNTQAVDFLKKHSGGKSINLIETEQNPNPKTIHILSDHDKTYQAIKDELSNGGFPFIGCTSKKESEKLDTFLNDQGFNRGLLIHADNRGDTAQAEFLSDPNGALFNEATGENDRYTHVIYSPSLGSGFSIETPHFTTNYLLNAGNLASNEAMQMTARNRCANDIVVSFSRQRFENFGITDTEILEQGENEKKARNDGFYETDKHGKPIFTELGRFRITATRAINEDKNDFANNFLLLAQLGGYAINYDRKLTAPTANTKGLAKEVKAKRVNDIFFSEPINKKTADYLEAKQAPTQEDSDQLDRYKTTVMTGIDDIKEYDVKNFVDGDMARLINYETAHESRFICQQSDSKNDLTENRHASKTSIHDIFKITIAPLLNGSVIDKQAAIKFCELLRNNAAEINANDLGNYTAKKFNRPIPIMGRFVKKYGYELEEISRSNDGTRTFKLVAMERIVTYAIQRKTHEPINKNHFQQNQLQAA